MQRDYAAIRIDECSSKYGETDTGEHEQFITCSLLHYKTHDLTDEKKSDQNKTEYAAGMQICPDHHQRYQP